MGVIKQFKVGSKVVGRLEDDTFHTFRVAKTHFYIKGRGYPISNSILKELRDNQCKYIMIHETRAGGVLKLWKCLLDDYLDAVLIQEGGFEQQRVLPLSKMEEVR